MTKRAFFIRACASAFGLWATESHAQIQPYGVIEGGVERRQPLKDAERVTPVAGSNAPQDHKDGFAYGIGLGAEAPVTSVLFVGAEASASQSEADTEAEQFQGIEVVPSVLVGVIDRTIIHPRWSYAITVRAGLNLTRSVALYGLAGIGGERVRRDFEEATNVLPAKRVSTREKFDELTYGAGARLHLTDHVGVRVEYRRIDADDGYKPQRLTAGLLFRF